MKKEFTTKWKSSKQPRKQRKYLNNLPAHLRQKQMSATLDKELRKKHGIRSIEVKKGDEVSVMRGKFKKKMGKIIQVKIKENKVAIENISRKKKDGSSVNVWFHPSKLKIKTLNLDDKKRIKTKNIGEKNVQEKN